MCYNQFQLINNKEDNTGKQCKICEQFQNVQYQKMSQYSYHPSQPGGSNQTWNSNSFSDQWLDRLALDGYPIPEILNSIYQRYRENSVTFGKYLARRAASLKNSKYRVKNFLPKLPINMEVNQIISLLMDKYRISSDGAQLLLEDYWWIYQDQNEVLSQLAKKGMTILKCQEGRSNSVIIFCNEQMRNNYYKFGDAVCIDFKPITIKNNTKNKKHLVGIFTGQDTNLHHTLFCVALINEDKYQNYLNAIQLFLKAMKIRRSPKCFIVGNTHTLYKVICDINLANYETGRETFGCIVGWHHLMDKLIKLFKNHEKRDALIQKFGNILSALNKEEMKQKVSEMFQILPNNEVLQKFIADNSKYFVANNNHGFIGFGIQRDHFSMLYKIMYTFLKEVEYIGFFFHQTLKLQQMLLSRIRKGYEFILIKQLQSMGIALTDQLKYLSIRLERKLFKKFLMMYRTAVRHAKIISKSPDGLYYQVVFKTGKKYPYKAFVYTLCYDLKDCCWRCNCGFIYQSGIPCAHIIKMIRKFRGSLTYYINRRWMIQNSNFNPEIANHPQQMMMEPEKEDEQDNEKQQFQQEMQLSEAQEEHQQKQPQMVQDENDENYQKIINEQQIGSFVQKQVPMAKFQSQNTNKINHSQPEEEQVHTINEPIQNYLKVGIPINQQADQQFKHYLKQVNNSIQQQMIENKKQQISKQEQQKNIQLDIAEHNQNNLIQHKQPGNGDERQQINLNQILVQVQQVRSAEEQEQPIPFIPFTEETDQAIKMPQIAEKQQEIKIELAVQQQKCIKIEDSPSKHEKNFVCMVGMYEQPKRPKASGARIKFIQPFLQRQIPKLKKQQSFEASAGKFDIKHQQENGQSLSKDKQFKDNQ